MLIWVAFWVMLGMMMNNLWDFFWGLKQDDARRVGAATADAMAHVFITYALWTALP